VRKEVEVEREVEVEGGLRDCFSSRRFDLRSLSGSFLSFDPQFDPSSACIALSFLGLARSKSQERAIQRRKKRKDVRFFFFLSLQSLQSLSLLFPSQLSNALVDSLRELVHAVEAHADAGCRGEELESLKDAAHSEGEEKRKVDLMIEVENEEGKK